MYNQVEYSTDEVRNFKIISRKTKGPFSLDEWLSYIEFSNIDIEKFKSKENILELYPDFDTICKITTKYKKKCGKIVYKIVYCVNQLVTKKLYKPINKSIINNSNFPEYSIEDVNGKKNFADENLKKPVFKLYKRDSIRSKVQTYSLIDDRKIETNKKNSYENKNIIKKPRKALYSLVVKNIPENNNIKDLTEDLKNIFGNYVFDLSLHKDLNDTCKVNVLKNNEGLSRGLAFIDFYYKESLDVVFNSNEKFKLNFNILEIEKKNTR
tara:strand:- start:50 stop:850 length:801 start_codon:yes stop_codon:yes gene_type:complete